MAGTDETPRRTANKRNAQRLRQGSFRADCSVTVLRTCDSTRAAARLENKILMTSPPENHFEKGRLATLRANEVVELVPHANRGRAASQERILGIMIGRIVFLD